MTDFLKILQSRRTIRRYQELPIPSQTLKAILEAARWAQSWNNSQCWELVLITDPEIRTQLQKTVPTQNPAYDAIIRSSVLICVCAKAKLSGYFGDQPVSALGDWYMYDAGIVTQNICTQAHALGLGTVVVGWFDHASAKKIISLPQGYEMVSMIPLGHPVQQPPAAKRKELRDFVHIDRFGKKYTEA